MPLLYLIAAGLFTARGSVDAESAPTRDVHQFVGGMVLVGLGAMFAILSYLSWLKDS